jgi:hypothetical protein
VVIVQDNSHSDMELGKLVTDPAYVGFANRLWHAFPEKIGKELIYLSTPMPSAKEVRANTKEGFVVYFDTTMNLDRSLALLHEVINQELKGKGVETNCLDYIDLRVTDRVFYKMKDDCNGGGNNNGQDSEANNPDNQNQQQADQAINDQQVLTKPTMISRYNKIRQILFKKPVVQKRRRKRKIKLFL